MVLDRRPRKRSDCKDGVRPCPYVSCRFHLFIDIVETQNPGEPIRVRINHPDVDLADYEGPTCALDIADAGGATLEEAGAAMGLTRERIRQIEAVGMRRVMLGGATMLNGPW